jgi:hypothetical protein
MSAMRAPCDTSLATSMPGWPRIGSRRASLAPPWRPPKNGASLTPATAIRLVAIAVHAMTTPIIPAETDTEQQMLRARHLDLDYLSMQEVWAERELLGAHLARLIFWRQRRLRIVRRDHGGVLIDERAWAEERVQHLDRLLARSRGRVA